MQGVRGYSSWRWFFLLEGIATITISICAYFLVPSLPADAHWLNAPERGNVLAITATGDERPSSTMVRKLISFFKDIKNFVGGLMYFDRSFQLTICVRALANIHPQPSSSH